MGGITFLLNWLEPSKNNSIFALEDYYFYCVFILFFNRFMWKALRETSNSIRMGNEMALKWKF